MVKNGQELPYFNPFECKDSRRNVNSYGYLRIFVAIVSVSVVGRSDAAAVIVGAEKREGAFFLHAEALGCTKNLHECCFKRVNRGRDSVKMSSFLQGD